MRVAGPSSDRALGRGCAASSEGVDTRQMRGSGKGLLSLQRPAPAAGGRQGAGFPEVSELLLRRKQVILFLKNKIKTKTFI